MKGLWSALINTLLTGETREEKLGLTEEDKEYIISKVLEQAPGYQLTEEDKQTIIEKVLENLPDDPEAGTPPSGSKELELIASLTATEDCRMLICDRDSNGNPFELKNATLFIRSHPAASSTTDSSNLYSLATLNPDEDFTDNLNSHRINMLTSSLSRTEIKNIGCFFEVTAVEDETDEAGGRIAVFLGSPTLTTTLERNIPAGKKGVCKLGIYSSSTTCFIGKGSTMKIYGVRI